MRLRYSRHDLSFSVFRLLAQPAPHAPPLTTASVATCDAASPCITGPGQRNEACASLRGVSARCAYFFPPSRRPLLPTCTQSYSRVALPRYSSAPPSRPPHFTEHTCNLPWSHLPGRCTFPVLRQSLPRRRTSRSLRFFLLFLPLSACNFLPAYPYIFCTTNVLSYRIPLACTRKRAARPRAQPVVGGTVKSGSRRVSPTRGMYDRLYLCLPSLLHLVSFNHPTGIVLSLRHAVCASVFMLWPCPAGVRIGCPDLYILHLDLHIYISRLCSLYS
eukprot:GHVU01089208.1.p1 GENE.GHVU01089208.1~~GHVU01089208.1.p1  ORF type:complete len:274 (-),score=-27.70 GHVU01089208.1:155-976(-)